MRKNYKTRRLKLDTQGGNYLARAPNRGGGGGSGRGGTGGGGGTEAAGGVRQAVSPSAETLPTPNS